MPVNPNKRQRIESDANGGAWQQVSECKIQVASNVLTLSKSMNNIQHTANQFCHHHHHHHRLPNDRGEDRFHRYQQRTNQHDETFIPDTDPWSELFDSFKDANHLKELHCR
jgi:hypothetical protein